LSGPLDPRAPRPPGATSGTGAPQMAVGEQHQRSKKCFEPKARYLWLGSRLSFKPELRIFDPSVVSSRFRGLNCGLVAASGPAPLGRHHL